jgi:hypothetical protein
MSSDAIDTGLINLLTNDATLATYATGGVFLGLGPASPSGPYVVVTLQSSSDKTQFRGTAWEECKYQIEAIGLASAATTVAQAAGRIHDLLQGNLFSISGYTTIRSERESRLLKVEDISSTRWHHRGGVYIVWAQ